MIEEERPAFELAAQARQQKQQQEEEARQLWERLDKEQQAARMQAVMQEQVDGWGCVWHAHVNTRCPPPTMI